MATIKCSNCSDGNFPVCWKSVRTEMTVTLLRNVTSDSPKSLQDLLVNDSHFPTAPLKLKRVCLGSFRLSFSITSGDWGSPLSPTVLPSMLRGACPFPAVSQRGSGVSPRPGFVFPAPPLAPLAGLCRTVRSQHRHRHPLPPALRAPAGDSGSAATSK